MSEPSKASTWREQELSKLFVEVISPKPGKKSQKQQAEEAAENFVTKRKAQQLRIAEVGQQPYPLAAVMYNVNVIRAAQATDGYRTRCWVVTQVSAKIQPSDAVAAQ